MNYNSAKQIALVRDMTPPMPNPMTWLSVPAMLSATSVVMTATTATSAVNPPVRYLFSNTVNGATSDWILSPAWTNSGLTTFQTYGYRVKARDAYSNETAWSTNLATVTLQADACDTLAVRDTLDITGATLTLNVSAPRTAGTYVIASYGSLTGSFAATNGLPGGCSLNYSYNGTNIAVTIVSDTQGTVYSFR